MVGSTGLSTERLEPSRKEHDMRTIERATDIKAHPSRIWQILSATEEYDSGTRS